MQPFQTRSEIDFDRIERQSVQALNMARDSRYLMNNNQYVAEKIQHKDLPIFNGDNVLEWPNFISEFKRSTEEYNINRSRI